MEKMFENIGSVTPDSLIAGHEVPLLVKGITLAKNQGILARGTVLGIATASGLAMPVDSSKADGTQTAFGILTGTVDTGSGSATEDTKSTAYVSGLFNKNAMTFGGTDDAADHEAKLRELGIFLKETIEY